MNIFLINPTDYESIQLSEEESFHCIKVLRYKEDDSIHMVDGAGGYYTGVIKTANVKACVIERTNKINDYSKRDYRLHIAIAPTKNIDRFEWFLEKATEIGIDEITPIICKHSERRVIKTDRLNKVIVAAMKQSIKAYLPKLNEIVSFTDFLSSSFYLPSSNSQRFICSCDAGKDSLLKNLYQSNLNAVILIGPEGDFSKEEIAVAGKIGFKTVSLGESRLRTETAGIVACHTIQLLNQ